MSKETPESKKLEVVKLFFTGCSYDDIAQEVGIGKATVSAIIEELKDGGFPQFGNVEELVDDMRDITVGLRRSSISPAEGISLFILLKRLLELGVAPLKLEAWVKMSQSLPEDTGFTRSRILDAAMKLAGLETDQGLSFEGALDKYTHYTSELEEVHEKLRSSRTELSQLKDTKGTLTPKCKELEADKKRLETENEKLIIETQKLGTQAADLQAAVSNLEEKVKNLNDTVKQKEEQSAELQKKIGERTYVLKELENLGFSTEVLNQLQTRLTGITARYGKKDLMTKFFESVDNYDLCLRLENTRQELTGEVDTLNKQKESLTRFAEKVALTPGEIIEGLTTLKALQKKGVSPPAIVTWQKILTDAQTDPQSFQKLVAEYGSIQNTINARHTDLEDIGKEFETKKEALNELKISEESTKSYISSLKESTLKEIEELGSAAKGAVSNLCQEMRQDIDEWGNMRAEIGVYQNQLKLARYFGTIPLSDEAVSNLVNDLGPTIVLQYLYLARAWCRLKYNTKQKPPSLIYKKYYQIGEYTSVEPVDVITWALTTLAEGVDHDQR